MNIQDQNHKHFYSIVQDMAPKIVQQQKIIVKQKDQSFNSSSMANSRLTFAPITASAITKVN